LAAAATAGALALTLAACGQGDPGDGADRSPGGSAAPTSVKLVTHGSFAASDEVLAQFESETGLKLELLPTDDAGAMLNQLILTKDAPIGDAVFGIDNTFASRAIEAGILEPYKSGAAGSEAAGAGGLDVGDELTAIDQSAVCVNADRRVLPDGGSITLADLVKPEFKDKLVVENPATSSPGLACLLATIADQGEDGWLDYWRALKANGVKIAAGWEEAYYTEFSGPSSEGSRPLVVSYSTSPAAEVPEGESEPATVYAPKTCFRQVEYAGVLKGAANPEGARLAVDFLLSDAFQADIPGQMWVYPAKASAPLPEEWVKWAELPAETFELSPEKITEKREDWLAEFADQILG
jgi:thiamine transport system substrate-binding protein